MYGSYIDYLSPKGKKLVKNFYDSNKLDCIIEPDL